MIRASVLASVVVTVLVAPEWHIIGTVNTLPPTMTKNAVPRSADPPCLRDLASALAQLGVGGHLSAEEAGPNDETNRCGRGVGDETAGEDFFGREPVRQCPESIAEREETIQPPPPRQARVPRSHLSVEIAGCNLRPRRSDAISPLSGGGRGPRR